MQSNGLTVATLQFLQKHAQEHMEDPSTALQVEEAIEMALDAASSRTHWGVQWKRQNLEVPFATPHSGNPGEWHVRVVNRDNSDPYLREYPSDDYLVTSEGVTDLTVHEHDSNVAKRLRAQETLDDDASMEGDGSEPAGTEEDDDDTREADIIVEVSDAEVVRGVLSEDESFSEEGDHAYESADMSGDPCETSTCSPSVDIPLPGEPWDENWEVKGRRNSDSQLTQRILLQESVNLK